MIRFLGNLLLYTSALAAIGCALVYGLLAPWWRSEEGRHLFSFQVVVAAVLSLSVVRVLFDPDGSVAWFAWLRLVVFALVPIVLAWRLWLIIRAQVLRR